MAIKNFDAIVADMIDNIQTVNPNVDVKIGAVVRDIFIDVNALELESLYTIADNTSKAQSVVTARGPQLTRLGYNYNQTRNPATRSKGVLVIEIKQGIQAPTPINIGDQFYTKADTNNASKVYLNTQYQLATPGMTLLTVPVVALEAGSIGDTAPYTVTESSYDFADAIYNPEAIEDGLDEESDIDFAFRLPYTITGQYINTARGVINALLSVTDINGAPFFITPEHPLSRGPYTFDVLLQRNAGYFGTPIQEVAPANAQDYVFKQQPLYDLVPINQVTVYNPMTNQTTYVDPSQYTVYTDPADVVQVNKGSIRANARLHWLVPPPTLPYTISYNIDHTVIDAQNNYDSFNEATADVLYKQAKSLPIYLTVQLAANSSVSSSTLYTNGLANSIALFNKIKIAGTMTDREVQFAFLQDANVLDINVANFDTTPQIVLPVPSNSAFITASASSVITPLSYYWEKDVASPVAFYNIAARLWIGKPSLINALNFNPTTGFNLVSTSDTGVIDQEIVQNIRANWQTQILPYYDSVSQTLVLNFTSLPPNTVTNPSVTFNLVQKNIATQNDLSYLTLAPPLVSPVQQFTPAIPLPVPQYGTVLPVGLSDISQATLYKNGIALTPTTANAIGDYQIVSVDSNTGLITIQFTDTPSVTDVFQFGLLNPSIIINYTSQNLIR